MKKLLYKIIAIIFISNSLFAHNAFSELCFHFNGYDVIKADLLGKYYDVFNYGGSFGISTPIYFGRLMANTSFLENKSLTDINDNYYSITTTVEWDLPVNITKYFQVIAGVGTGNYFMFFSEKEEESKLESEICLLGKLGVELNLLKHLTLTCNYYKKEISTFHKLYIEEISLGFYIRFNTSSGFREILK